jgi:hypothetical protein
MNGPLGLCQQEDPLMEKKQVRYEKPLLEKLDVVGQGTGQCDMGSTAQGHCTLGGSAGGQCLTGSTVN